MVKLVCKQLWVKPTKTDPSPERILEPLEGNLGVIASGSYTDIQAYSSLVGA